MCNTHNWIRAICIGKGSFGAINLAVDKSDGDIFAVKSVIQTSARLSQALENEIRILKSLSSPYVVAYRGDDVTSENSSVVYRNLHMEYMPGGTVAGAVKQNDDVTLRSYTRCIVSALSYIHQKNIVHCDVKGRNVLVGEVPGVAKLADFGSAIEMGGSVSGTRGSPLWMTPEVVRGEYQGPESDVWSLGCTVIEMVTGKPAWQDRGVDTLRQIGYSDELPKLPAHFFDELRDFLSKCLRRDPSERWNCDQLLQHPFLSSISSSSEPTDKKLSPRCVFDWPEFNYSDEETSEMETDSYRNAYQRIGELASGSGANWESEGWELVRNAVEDMSPEYYSGWVGDTENDEAAATFSGSGRTDQEYRRDSSDEDHKCTNNHAEGTSCGCSSRDTDNNYSSCVPLLTRDYYCLPPDIFITNRCFHLILILTLILNPFLIVV